MTRTIELALNNFSTTPTTLVDPATNAPTVTLNVGVKALLHHCYRAKFGEGVEDTGVYEYEPRLSTGPDWRFRGSGIGADKEAKRNVSNELGKGFARWFHYEHMGFTYFCPFEDLLGRKNLDGSEWTRKEAGDLPDYVCGKNSRDVNLLEAKGRYRPLSFKTKEFAEFRAQIQRARLLDAQRKPLRVKGFISAARWATEETPGVRSKLLVEDPSTDGDAPGQEGYPQQVGLSMVVGHYAPVLDRLQLPVHADAIRRLRQVPNQTGAKRAIWACIAGALRGRRFVGGVLPDRFTRGWGPTWPFFEEVELQRIWHSVRHDSLFLLAPPMRFFGVEEVILRRVLAVAHRGIEAAENIEPAAVPDSTGSLSVHRDGTVLGPVDYFEPVGVLDL
jgi:hypothetical protein